MSAVRNPDEPDDTEAITIRLDALLNSPPIGQMPGTGGPELLVPFGLALPVAGALGAVVLRPARLSSSKSHA